MKKILLILCIGMLFACSSESTIDDNLNYPSEKIDDTNHYNQSKSSPTNYNLIHDELEIFRKSEEFQNRSPLYGCSEGFGASLIANPIKRSMYLNPFYVPSNPIFAPISGIYDLQSFLDLKFQDLNASGSNNRSISINFEIFTDDILLDAIEANRVYNEFLCQLRDLTSDVNYPLQHNISFTIDYLLCCTGSSCCYPVLMADGVVYWN